VIENARTGACGGTLSAAPPQPDPGIVVKIDYDAYGKLKYKLDFALYGDGQPGVFPITFMFVGHYFPKTVRMYAIEPGTQSAREILYDPNYFAHLAASQQSTGDCDITLFRHESSFLGGPLAALPNDARPETVVCASRGTFSYIGTEKVPDNLMCPAIGALSLT
jgi:glucan biosynthesis protein